MPAVLRALGLRGSNLPNRTLASRRNLESSTQWSTPRLRFPKRVGHKGPTSARSGRLKHLGQVLPLGAGSAKRAANTAMWALAALGEMKELRQADTISFGLIGAGNIGRAYASAFSACSVARLVAVADIDPRACRMVASRAGCVAVDQLRAMADPTFVDAVLVCTPPSTHAAISTYLLEHGVHVLCEKPLAFDAASAQQMFDCARRSGVTLTMASKFRFVDDIIRAKNISESGLVGDIILFENSFTAHVDMTNRWNSDPATSGGGVLIDNGTHSVDVMRYFLGSLAYVKAIEGRRMQRVPVEDTVRLLALSSGGVLGSIDLSWSVHKDQDAYVSIYGTAGTIHVGWRESRYRLAASGDWVVFGDGYDKLRALASQLDNFARALIGQERLVITPEDSLASVEVIEAAYDALRRREWVAVSGRSTRSLARSASSTEATRASTAAR